MSENEQLGTLSTRGRKTTVVTVEEESGEGINKADISYNPPTSEPVQAKIPLTFKTEVYITGNYSDLIDILSNKALIVRDYVREDSSFTSDDIRGNDGVIAARAGRLNDLAVLYGIVYDGNQVATGVDAVRFYIRDGANINVSVEGMEIFVEYGNKKDLHTRFSYDAAARIWYRSPGNNRNGTGYPPATEPIVPTRLP